MNTINIETLRRNIKSLRVRAGFTQLTAAEELEVSRETMFRWEKEPETMPITKLARLANLYNCSVSDFFME